MMLILLGLIDDSFLARSLLQMLLKGLFKVPASHVCLIDLIPPQPIDNTAINVSASDADEIKRMKGSGRQM